MNHFFWGVRLFIVHRTLWRSWHTNGNCPQNSAKSHSWLWGSWPIKRLCVCVCVCVVCLCVHLCVHECAFVRGSGWEKKGNCKLSDSAPEERTSKKWEAEWLVNNGISSPPPSWEPHQEFGSVLLAKLCLSSHHSATAYSGLTLALRSHRGKNTWNPKCKALCDGALFCLNERQNLQSRWGLIFPASQS